jgi:hypothetical protein
MIKVILQFVTFILLFFLSVVCFAQESEDVIYLKNGSVIRGIIIEQVLNESIKIKTREGNIFVYKYDEISKIAKEENTEANSKSKIRYIGTFNGGICVQIPADTWGTDKMGYHINLSNGILFNDVVGLRLDVRYAGFDDISSTCLNAACIFGEFNKKELVKYYGIVGIGLDYLKYGSYGESNFGLDLGAGMNFEIVKNSGLSINFETKYHYNTNDGTAKGYMPISLGLTYIK